MRSVGAVGMGPEVEATLNGNGRAAVSVGGEWSAKAFAERLRRREWYDIGFPGAKDFDYSELSELLSRRLLNNYGDVYVEGAGGNHTKDVERAVVDWVADLFRSPRDDRWGTMTSCGSIANLSALRLARKAYGGDVIVFYSAAAHHSVGKAIDILGLRSVRIRADAKGRMDLFDLTAQLTRHRDSAVVVVATAGTTMTEAVDDVRAIRSTLNVLAMRGWVHVDAALAGIPLALLPPGARPGLDFVDGADSIMVSGHKFLGSPSPCAVLVARASDVARISRPVAYTATADTTVEGSRSGQTPLFLLESIRRHGIDGHRARAEAARALAARTVEMLAAIGWEAWRHEHAFTVVLRTPPPAVTAKWVLASEAGWSHVITMPGIGAEQMDEFVADVAAAMTGGRAAVNVPRQRGEENAHAVVGT